ncbi:MAG TPA: hypothetical protein VJ455_05370, partial [Ignavibacteria bacterium]|nr:hypothetical protein [Ignavibacteria bacterium]
MNNIIKYGVVFDTNVYRSLVISKKSIIELKKSLEIVKYNEKSHNVFSYAHPIVMSELLYHLTDINDKDYQTCKKAVYFLIEHCCDEKDRIHVIEDSESLLSHILFGINFDQNKKHVQSLQITCKYIHDNFDNNFEDWILEYLFKNKEYVEEKENEFAKLMEKHVIKYLNPTANSWNPLRDNSEARIKALKLIGSDDFL